MHPVIAEKCEALAALCRRFGVRRLEVFGSAARGTDFDPRRSDADFLVSFSPRADDLARFLDFKEALESLLGVSVDLVERGAVECSRNYIRRRSILAEAEPIYGS
jgi:predicted nucleotidyltransferase